MAFRPAEDLEVWKRASRLAVSVYGAIGASREFALRDQMIRAAISVPSNIAEGSERGGREFVYFLRVARGSLAELRTQCHIAAQVGILAAETTKPLIAEATQIARMLTALARSLGEGRPPQKLKTEN